MKLVREGLQIGAWQWALVNRTPRSARRSIFGVLASGWPSRQPTQSFKSSTAIISTLYFCVLIFAWSANTSGDSSVQVNNVKNIKLIETARPIRCPPSFCVIVLELFDLPDTSASVSRLTVRFKFSAFHRVVVRKRDGVRNFESTDLTLTHSVVICDGITRRSKGRSLQPQQEFQIERNTPCSRCDCS